MLQLQSVAWMRRRQRAHGRQQAYSRYCYLVLHQVGVTGISDKVESVDNTTPAAIILDAEYEIIISFCLCGISFGVGAATCQVSNGCGAGLSPITTFIGQAERHIIGHRWCRFFAQSVSRASADCGGSERKYTHDHDGRVLHSFA